jgi:integrase/recombinase XerD
MLTVYGRHLKTCDHRGEGKDKGRDYRRCKCPVWVDGLLGGRDLRQSLKTRDFQKATEIVREWETKGTVEEEKQDAPVTIEHACAEFLRDARARELREPTLYKYRLLFRRLQDFAGQQGVRYVAELNLDNVRAFRAGWADHNLAAMKKLERLRAFFRFCNDGNWIADNPAKKLKNPKITDSPTMPFSQHQVISTISACHEYPDRANAPRVRALVLLLRYSGLRIRDAVTLGRERIRDGKLFLYTLKLGRPSGVRCRLLSRRRSKRSRASATFFGRASRIRKVAWATGSDRSAPYSAWLACRMATRTGSATPSQSNYCWPECRSSGYRFCWATRV